jgi:hypothetical protein
MSFMPREWWADCWEHSVAAHRASIRWLPSAMNSRRPRDVSTIATVGSRGALAELRDSLRSLVPERHHRVDLGCPPRRDIARQ